MNSRKSGGADWLGGRGLGSRRQLSAWLTRAALLLVLGAAVVWWSGSRPSPSPSMPLSAGVLAVRPRLETRPTLDPALFVGKARRAHEVARAMSDLLDQLYCYCGCDKTAGHKSLLSCYTDGHAPT
jgi:Protein of unknown function with PCYCGC motif